MKSKEEAKATLDGVEIPIQYIDCRIPHRSDFPIPHYHDYVEVLYGTGGIAEVWSDGEVFPLRKGTMLVINSKSPHTVRGISDNSEYIVIKFMPQVLYGAQQSVFEFKYIVPFMIAGNVYSKYFDEECFENTEIPEIMKGISREWNNMEYGFEIALRIYVLKISLWLVRHWHDSSGGISGLIGNDAITAGISRALEFAQKNYATVTAAETARHCGMSYSYFSRVFKKYMKNSFNEYINFIRITEAKRMLVCTDMDITSVAMETGFATSSYFIERFRKECGVTPKQFRKKFKGD